MAASPILTVKWGCPICHTMMPLHMVVERPDRRGDVSLVVDGESSRNLKRHIKIHIAEIKRTWRALESALGSLGYSMEVQVDKRIDPDEDDDDGTEPICRCGHPLPSHKDQRDDWTACHGSVNCGCLGYSEDDEPTIGDVPHGGDYPW